MSTLKVDAIRHNSATSDAITTAADGTCTAKLTNYPHRNLFLNGAVNISQRGDSYASGYTYKADQWYIFPTGSTTTRLTTSPPDGFTYYFRFPSATNSIIISQQIELDVQGKVGKYKKKTVTVSWYARSESSNKMYVDAAFKNASGGGDYTTIVAGSGSPQDITSSWARYSQTFTISATPHSNNKCFSVMIRTPSSGSGSTGTLEATGFQCEFGDTATDFEHVAIAEDLSRCQRYYYQVGPLQTDVFGQGRTDNDNLNMVVLVHYPVTMRSAPATLTTTGSAGNYDVRRDTTKGCSAVPTIHTTSSIHLAQLICQSNSHGWGTASPMQLQADGGGSAFLGFSAEL